jgi:signal transduction histidine kinase
VFLAVLVGAYSLAAGRCRPALSIGVLLTAATVTAVSLQLTGTTQGLLFPFVVLLPVGLAGVTIRAARTRAEDSLRRAEELRQNQDAATRAAVEQERARIARELHDVVSHHVSVMVIQATAAGQVLDLDPEAAREALGSIAASGRQAMTELRNLLGLLAPPGGEPAPDGEDALSPQPGLDQVGALVERVRAAGQPVTLLQQLPSTPDLGTDLPRGVDIAAYRVVQETLTNALRYAPGARTEVVVDVRDGELVIQVTDDGVADRPAITYQGSGSGLVGLAERLRLYGGTLDACRRLGGGFRVRASVPLEGVTGGATHRG